MHRFIRYLLALTAALALQTQPITTAHAQPTYPTKPLRMVVGYLPGGAADNVARLVANKLGTELGQQVIVDNKPGAGSTLGTAAVAKSAPDGYTLLMGSTTGISSAPHLYKNLPYDPRRDLVPVALVAQMPQVLVVHPSVPATDLRGLVEWIKKGGTPVNYASFGNGTSAHLTMELLKNAAGLDLRHIPYKGSSAALTDVIGGQVLVAMDTFQATQPFVQAGKLRAIAMSGKARSSLAPQLPTFAELGYPAMTLGLWFGVFAPADTPRPIVDALTDALTRLMQTPGMRAQLAQQGAEPMLLTGVAARDFLGTDRAQWAEAARVSGARLD
ncbi:Bug family tripartite tricarboxylate transporter substrate binding protein [Variovorax ureilyticus]|uniref:Bug family tripartite tricarboxylate transporter substrate binding protein n=1 Tax=Variovorax ureilyticus TaxID=1836198 RepID=UPI003D663E40